MNRAPIRTAILSFGMSGQVFHAPFLHVHQGFQLYGVWERTKNIAEGKYPGVRTFRNLEDLLADPAIELVIVNTPNLTHFEYATKALEAGKHVIVEKPFTATSEEAQTLIQLANQKQLHLSVFQNRRWDSDFLTVKQVIDQKMLGEVVEAEFHFDRYKEELSPKVHKELPGKGTGVLYDLGAHIIDQALVLFGFPQAVFADIRILRPQSRVDDCFDLLLYYPSLRVRLHSSYLVREPLPAYILHGTKGSFLKSRADIQEAALMAGDQPDAAGWGEEPEAASGLLHTEINGKTVRQTLPTVQGNYLQYFDGIFKTIRQGAPLPVTATEGMAVIRIIEAAFRSHENRQAILL